MSLEIIEKLFTVDEYRRMGEVGILRADERLELIDGRIYQMSPIGVRHGACVTCAVSLFSEALGRRALISPQNPVELSNWTEPQPDIVVLARRSDYYVSQRPTGKDVLFAVEVTDSTLGYDVKIKVPLFAAAGVREVWIEDLRHDQLLVYRDPEEKAYKNTLTLRPGEAVSPLSFPEVSFDVRELLCVEPGR